MKLINLHIDLYTVLVMNMQTALWKKKQLMHLNVLKLIAYVCKHHSEDDKCNLCSICMKTVSNMACPLLSTHLTYFLCKIVFGRCICMAVSVNTVHCNYYCYCYYMYKRNYYDNLQSRFKFKAKLKTLL